MMAHGGFTDLLLSMKMPAIDQIVFDSVDGFDPSAPGNSRCCSRSRSVSQASDLEEGNGDGGSSCVEGVGDKEEDSSGASAGQHQGSSSLGSGDSEEEVAREQVSSDSSSQRAPGHTSSIPGEMPEPEKVYDGSLPVPPTRWRKRPRHGDIPDFREPSAVKKTALEEVFRRFGDRVTPHVVAPVIGMAFDSLPEAYDFYNLYSWELGFGIRYGPSRRNQANSKTSQDIVCGCEGKPRHLNSRSISCGCGARIRLHRTSDHGWFISEFKQNHNHGLSLTCGEKMHWASHRNIDPHTKSVVKTLRDNNVGLTQVLCVLGGFFGSMESIPFNKRSLRNLCAGISREHSEDDVKKTCELFSELKMKDPNFVDSVLCDKDGHIKALMWTNGKSRMQYKSFGDAITFDTTYRTNQYRMPFDLFVGVNNHFQSIILGGVLLTDETEDTFKWVFKEFVNLMGGKAPVTILTDQCRAMELAIVDVLQETNHRWCKWHVLRRAKECLGTLLTCNDAFKDQFHKICEYMLTVEEFETAWAQLIEDFGLHDHPFLTQIWDIREKWAKPYFSGIFCARMTSTQRSESANHMLKTFVPPGSSMNMFVRHYQKLQFDRYSEENFQEKRCRIGRVLLNTGGPIEKHASKVYTPAMFDLFQIALFQAGDYIVQEVLRGSLYIATHIDAEKRERWSRISYEVRVESQGEAFLCECGMYEHMGMLCCHAIRVIMYLGLLQIPERHIMKRWTRDACIVLPEHLRMYQKESPAMSSTSFRHTALYRTAIEMVQLGDSNPESYQVAMNSMLNVMSALIETSKSKDGLGLEQRLQADESEKAARRTATGTGGSRRTGELRPDMIAPLRSKDMGRPTSARAKPGYEASMPRTKFCSVCRGRGHYSSGCPNLEKSSKKPRRPPTCSNCGLVGLTNGVCKSHDSGIYALHFARNWTGKSLKKVLSPVGEGLPESRMNLLVDTLAIEGNIGHMPEKYRLCVQSPT